MFFFTPKYLINSQSENPKKKGLHWIDSCLTKESLSELVLLQVPSAPVELLYELFTFTAMIIQFTSALWLFSFNSQTSL